MIAILDVDYRSEGAVAACVVASDWAASSPESEHTVIVPEVAPYVPGRFFERELPCLRAVLGVLARRPDVIVIDGNVWLDADRPGLGAHLHEALARSIPVVGVAKTRFHDAPGIEVLRGESHRPLFVTAVGMNANEAAQRVATMHGEHRIPTLLARADRLARTG